MIEHVYTYCNIAGDTAYEVVRYTKKHFKQRRPDGSGGHVWNLKGVDKLPYRFPELIRGIADGQTVYIVEGEKDADRLHSLGLCATTTSGGAKSSEKAVRANLPPGFAEHLKGAPRIVVIADNDDAGRVHAQTVAAIASTVCERCLPYLAASECTTSGLRRQRLVRRRRYA